MFHVYFVCTRKWNRNEEKKNVNDKHGNGRRRPIAVKNKKNRKTKPVSSHFYEVVRLRVNHPTADTKAKERLFIIYKYLPLAHDASMLSAQSAHCSRWIATKRCEFHVIRSPLFTSPRFFFSIFPFEIVHCDWLIGGMIAAAGLRNFSSRSHSRHR